MYILPAIVALFIAPNFSHAASCQGDASNSCNGLLNKCTSDGGLCVVDSTTGTCCSLPSASTAVARSSGTTTTCTSDMDSSICADSDLTSVLSVTTSTHAAVDISNEGGSSANFKPNEECFNVEIGIILDDKPDEIAWEITSGRKSTLQQPTATVVGTSPYYDPSKYQEASDTFIACLPKGRYTFTIIDQGNDGICCSHGEGKYAVSYQPTGELIAQGGKFSSSESTTFKIPFVAPAPTDSDGDGFEDRTHNIIPTVPMTSDGQPSCSNQFGLHLVTDDYGVETTWELREKDDSTSDNYTDWRIVASGGPYTSDYTYDISYCVYPGKYAFVFYDWQCDGLMGVKSNGYYTLTVNGMEVHTGGTNMTQYDEVVELNFMNELTGNDEPAAYNPSDLSKYKKSTSGAREKMDCSRWMGIVLLMAARSFY